MRVLLRPFCLILLVAACRVCGATNTIRSAAELYHAVYALHDDLSPFDLRARVNAVNFEHHDLIVEIAVGDDSGNMSLLFYPNEIKYLPKPGDKIRATGRIQYGPVRKRIAQLQSLTLLGHGEPPEPIPAHLSELLSGGLDYRYVRVNAIVREAVRSAISKKWHILGIVDGKCSIAVPVLADSAEAERLRGLIGQEVTIHGFCSPTDPGPLQTGRQIRLCDPAAIQPSSASGGKRNVPSIDGLENIHPDIIDTLGLHSASGTVIAVWQRQHALLRESNGNLVIIDFLHPDTPPVGAVAKVIGFPKSNFIHVNLVNATAVSIASGELPPDNPTDVRFSEFWWLGSHEWSPEHDCHGKLVRVRGRALTTPSEKNHGRMLIGDGNGTLIVETGMLMPTDRGLTVGCDIQVTGVCVTTAEAWRSITPRYVDIALVPRYDSDIVILSRPSWWTPGRLLAVIGTLLAALLGILLWNVLLRRAAARKGRELAREQLKHLRTETKAVERTRLAVELHDTLAQNLTGVSLEITAAAQCGITDAKGLLSHLTIASKALNSCRRGLRDSLWDLRNRALEERDLNAAIRKTLQPHVKGVGLAVRFNVLRSRLSEQFAHDILRIVRELTLNGIRHGNATDIRIAGSIDGGRLHFSVTDDGCGFDPDDYPGISDGHFGIEGIRERLSVHSGSIRYKSHPGLGTKAIVDVNLPDELDEEEL